MKFPICLFSILLFTASGFGQKEIDSLLKKANFELYEHPATAIQIGMRILNNKSTDPENTIEALLLVSTAYSSERNYAKSLEYAVKADKELPKINNDSFKFIVFTRLGVQYQQLKIYDKAHSYLDKAIQVANNTTQEFNRHKLLGFNYAVRGMVYKEQMSCDIAQNYFNKSLYHYSKSPKESINYANLSVIIYNKGNCFLSLNQIDSAKISFTDSYKYAESIQANSLKAFANKGLAEVNTIEGKYDKAISLLLDASKMSEGVGDLVLNQGIYKGLSENYFVTNAIAQHELYNRKYEETTQLIKKNETKTINQFVVQINGESNAAIRQVKSDSLYYKIPLASFIFIMCLLLIFERIKYLKKYRNLKIQREKLENPTS
jgi:tetratricopeptide (TPR) repeat protein